MTLVSVSVGTEYTTQMFDNGFPQYIDKMRQPTD